MPSNAAVELDEEEALSCSEKPWSERCTYVLYMNQWCDDCMEEHREDCFSCGCECGFVCDRRFCEECGDIPSRWGQEVHGNPDTATFLRLPRKVGLEVELEGDYIDDWTSDPPEGIGAKGDGSLMSFPAGAEFVTPPGYGHEMEMKVKELYAWARRQDYEDSEDAGLHVHVDVSDLDDKQRWFLVALVAATQDSLFGLDPKREYNSYASKVEYLPDEALTYAELGHAKYADGRTICHVPSRYNTAEFRLMGSTTDDELALAWASLCQHMVEYCTNGVNRKTVEGLARTPKGKVQLNALYLTVHLPTWARRKLNITFDERNY